MKTYKCEDCGRMFDGRNLWVCEDDRLRCGPCVNEYLMRCPRGIDFSAVKDQVEGRIENEAMCREEGR